MMISLLAAMDRNLVIGNEKGIPWHLPMDLKRFRTISLHKPIVMGRTTFEHIGKPLDKRINMVLTRRADFRPEGVTIVRSPSDAINEAMIHKHNFFGELVVIGGGEVYRAFAPLAYRMYLTFVKGEFSGTTHFPAAIPTQRGREWKLVHDESHDADEKNPYPHRYIMLEHTRLIDAPEHDFSVKALAEWALRLA
jgi:dihydrofolate reductase